MAVRQRPVLRYATRSGEEPRGLAALDRPILDGDLQQTLIGRRLHAVIAGVCAEGHGGLIRDRVREACLDLVRREEVGWHRRSITQRIESYAQIYFAFFGPPPDWHFLGAELSVADGLLDLAWESARAEVLYDEVKSGGYRAPVIEARHREQIERYRRDGVTRFGSRFRGVRLLVLGAPYASRLLRPSGELVPLDATPYRFGETVR